MQMYVGDTRKDIARQAAFGFLLSQERQRQRVWRSGEGWSRRRVKGVGGGGEGGGEY